MATSIVQEELYIQSAQAGDMNAFNELVLFYQDRVYNLTYRIIQDPASADDLTQETFVTAYRKLGQFKGGNFKAWLLRIATNACYDELRRHKRRPTDSIDDEDYDDESNARLVSLEEGPESQFQRGELQSAIQDCFDHLSGDFRMVVMLSDVEEYSYDEIAEVVNISLGTVKSRISRARAQLRDCLRGKGELLPAQFRSSDSTQ